MKENFNFEQALEGCLRGDRRSQALLFEHFYPYAMSICLRYSNGRLEAADILHEGFYNALMKIKQYDKIRPFRFWLRQIMVHSAIDYFRANKNYPQHTEWTDANDNEFELTPDPELYPGEDVLPILQELSPAYRIVFVLSVIEEFSHREIAEQLGISESASRSNLARAKERLKILWIEKHGLPIVKSKHKLGK